MGASSSSSRVAGASTSSSMGLEASTTSTSGGRSGSLKEPQDLVVDKPFCGEAERLFIERFLHQEPFDFIILVGASTSTLGRGDLQSLLGS